MKLSKILNAFRGKVFASDTDNKNEPTNTAPEKHRSTPIYDFHCTSSQYGPQLMLRPTLVVTNALESEPAVESSATSPQPNHTDPASPALLSPKRRVVKKTNFKHLVTYSSYRSQNGTSTALKNNNGWESDQIASIAAPQPLSVAAQALLALPVIEESAAEDTNVYELAAGRSSTASLPADASHEPETSNQNATTDGKNHFKKTVSFEEEIKRLFHENERQQVQIHNLEAQLSLAERRVETLQAGKLPCRRKLKKRISELVDEVQSKEEEVKKWVNIHQDSVQAQSTVALQAISDDMKASACLLRDICHELRAQVQDFEQKRRTLDRKTRRMAIGWIEDEFEELCYRLTEGSSEE
jgi:hypothetical protein